jgi:hypothetical protein
MAGEARTLGARERLALIFDWYRGMVAGQTGRLVYQYRPVLETAVADGSPIRDIASVWDVELLSHFLHRRDLLPLAHRTLEHYCRFLVRRNGRLMLDDARLGEPSGIAHSAFLLLGLLSSELAGREERVLGLAEGVLHQQRQDGSFKIYFGDTPDEGLEFYPGEALLALLETYPLTRDTRYLEAAERGFTWHARRDVRGHRVTPDLLVFYANWQSQYCALLYRHTRKPALRDEVRDHVFALHDRVIHEGFYADVECHPVSQAAVEVACALEGLNAAYTIAREEQDTRRQDAYAEAVRVALAYLFRVQCVEGCAERERGGLGTSLTDRTQRIDVTGHLVGGLLETLRNGLAQ